MIAQNVSQGLLKFFKIEQADPHVKQEFLSSLEQLMIELTSSYISENLPESDFQAFSKLLEEDETGAKAIEFAKQKIPDFDKKLGELLKVEINKLI